MVRRWVCGCFVSFFIMCSLCSSAERYGSRKDYTIPFRIEGGYIPIQATISCQSWELDKTFDEISTSDPDFLVFAKGVVQDLLDGHVKGVKDAIITASPVEKKQLESFDEVPLSYEKYELDDIRIKSVVFVEDAFYFFCLADKDGEQEVYNYLFRKKKNGKLGWIAFGYDNLDSVIVPLLESLKKRFLNEGGFEGVKSPNFTNQKVLTPDSTHENFVALNYNAISFAEGVPLYNETGHDLLEFLLRYWDCKLHGSFDELAVFYDKKSIETMRGEIERSGIAVEAYTRDMQRIRKGEPYTSMRLTMALIADPITFVYETGGRGRVLYNDGEGYRFIRYHSFDPVRDIFDEIVRDETLTLEN